jgi:glutamate-1-semialdehyde 2,1-aminomutase
MSHATVSTPAELDRRRIRTLIEREEGRLAEATRASEEMYGRGSRVLVGGVASSFQVRKPWPIYLTRGEGPAVWDVDGTQRLDLHNGFGSMVQGHAHPTIGRAIRDRYPGGTHFGAPGEDAIVVGEELARRWRLPKWRYTTSGSESTMDAIRIARGFTGRDGVIRMVGSYHGHHDAVMAPDEGGVPSVVADLTAAVPFNNAEALERRIEELDRERGRPACVIIEPAMMLGMILPKPGYLEAVREITRRHGVVLIFDEVKIGLSIAAGGAVERFGVRPDLVTLAKALGGGLPSGAIGGTEEIMEVVEQGAVRQVGTYNGNALSMAAARANLLEVLTPEAYAHFERVSGHMSEGCRHVLDDHGLSGYALGVGARGCVTLSPTRIVDHATLTAHQDPELIHLTWLYSMNRGLFLTPARPDQWTVSVAHSEEDADSYVAVFAELLRELVA